MFCLHLAHIIDLYFLLSQFNCVALVNECFFLFLIANLDKTQ